MLHLHDYIYPADGNDRIINNKPYEHLILVAILRDELISRPSDFHSNIYMYDGTIVFPRIPVPALTLASAAVYAALAEYSTGTRVNAEFSQATCGDIYKLMRKLYDAALSNGDEHTGITAIPIQFDAMEG